MDEMWSFVGHKGNPRWLWHAIDHHTGKVLAYVFGRRKDEVFTFETLPYEEAIRAQGRLQC
jgi:IS1 family transposase